MKTKHIDLDLGDAPDFEERVIYQIVSEMFGVDVSFRDTSVIINGPTHNLVAWLAFHILPMELVEA
jgi:hypothetical protein